MLRWLFLAPRGQYSGRGSPEMNRIHRPRPDLRLTSPRLFVVAVRACDATVFQDQALIVLELAPRSQPPHLAILLRLLSLRKPSMPLTTLPPAHQHELLPNPFFTVLSPTIPLKARPTSPSNSPLTFSNLTPNSPLLSERTTKAATFCRSASLAGGSSDFLLWPAAIMAADWRSRSKYRDQAAAWKRYVVFARRNNHPLPPYSPFPSQPTRPRPRPSAHQKSTPSTCHNTASDNIPRPRQRAC